MICTKYPPFECFHPPALQGYTLFADQLPEELEGKGNRCKNADTVTEQNHGNSNMEEKKDATATWGCGNFTVSKLFHAPEAWSRMSTDFAEENS